MRAVVCKKFGTPDDLVVEDLPDLTAGAGEVKIAMRAAGVNFADNVMVQGKYQVQPEVPFTPGSEMAGEIMEVGEGVDGLAVGDHVFAGAGHGAFAEQVVVKADKVFKVPSSMDYATAATFVVAYGTSHHGLTEIAKLQKDEFLLVNGAAGGVGLTAVECGKVIGAKVIALASSPEKLEVCKSKGADYLIDYTKEDVRARVKKITGGKGANVVYDPVGGKAFDDALRSTAVQARVMVIGFAGGGVPQIPANYLLVKNLTVLGYYWGAYHQLDPKSIARSNAQLFQWLGEGKIKPHVSMRFPLEETKDALNALLQRKSTGKVVVTNDV
ncbi:MAG: NADPH:quinone oxidoreductase family protein [Rhodospirillales bacterium]|nr:NADPH:quinone oxidoreductase family protein [Rhodospirillales bacterium]